MKIIKTTCMTLLIILFVNYNDIIAFDTSNINSFEEANQYGIESIDVGNKIINNTIGNTDVTFNLFNEDKIKSINLTYGFKNYSTNVETGRGIYIEKTTDGKWKTNVSIGYYDREYIGDWTLKQVVIKYDDYNCIVKDRNLLSEGDFYVKFEMQIKGNSNGSRVLTGTGNKNSTVVASIGNEIIGTTIIDSEYDGYWHNFSMNLDRELHKDETLDVSEYNEKGLFLEKKSFVIKGNAEFYECNDKVINIGHSFQPMENVLVKEGSKDITSETLVKRNTVDISKAGEYLVVYEVLDSEYVSNYKYRKITVVDNFMQYEKEDINKDGKIDIKDLACVASNYNKSVETVNIIDLNGDGIIDIYDLVIVSRKL